MQAGGVEQPDTLPEADTTADVSDDTKKDQA